MKTIIPSLAILIPVILISCQSKDDFNVVQGNFKIVERKLTAALQELGNSARNPRSLDKDGSPVLVQSWDWTSGFFPGCLWYMYEYSGAEKWRKAAHKFTMNVEPEKSNDTTHDMGFKMFCSFGNGYRLSGNLAYKDILLQSAKTLVTRFNPIVGCIRSWNHHEQVWQFPVIIDNMMNLELLFWATKISGDSSFYNIAVRHAETTLKNHFRKDNSSWHVLDYDTTNGAVLNRHTHQGTGHQSAWARGQAWGLYGFTMCYRETRKKLFLEHARKIADYILHHPNLPEDMVPYWDFDAPHIPDEPRDVSAAAIICSSLHELSLHLAKQGKPYKIAADRILATLSTPAYLAGDNDNSKFLLMHAVGNMPDSVEVDVPVIYADYYFLEANIRKMKIDRGDYWLTMGGSNAVEFE